MLAEKTTILEFEEVKQEYAAEDARGIPMSVRARYERALSDMRQRIRRARSDGRGKMLGELLMEEGVLDSEKLQRALAEQERRGKRELLGEVLLSLGLVDEDALFTALRAQAREN